MYTGNCYNMIGVSKPSIALHLLLLGSFLICAFGLEMNRIRLVGGSSRYISLPSRARYSLQCQFKADYDDVIYEVRWYKDGQLVYSWQFEALTFRAFGALSGRVETTNRENLQNIHFSRTSLDISGVYVCEVRGQTSGRSDPFNLVVLDVPSDNFRIRVSLLSSELESEDVPASEAANNYTIDGFEEKEGEETMLNPANCTLVWEFLSPAIFPRPNVTCGFYSYLHDDVVESIPAGLTMHHLQNGSWQAGFERTYIPIVEIPRESRLGCSVTVPETDYRRVIKFEDNFEVDHMIDSEGCPSVDLDSHHKMQVEVTGGSFNCRGDLVPSSSTDPMEVLFRCPPGQVAGFSNGSAFHSWQMTMFCNARDTRWTRLDALGRQTAISNLTEFLPICAPMVGIAQTAVPSLTILVTTIIWLLLHTGYL